ncbi:type II toxin-antitoxin system HipA family toxin [Shewanella sp. YLB-07]|uniref:type II toxin-antitoxin system HipA family toxin n=1 Tax=Shewanella sp. YLB-07 TaxID=2601268 RepID=UPI00128C74C1|nr:HipA domain-containing protein [Shewanella sp. YLB-07]MPY24552.1 type II toxin-antitoxin system HipA family toxin [Shewanella sp. YLB-07]
MTSKSVGAERVFVFIDGLEAKPVVCGVADLDETSPHPIGRFRYGKSYLARLDAFPLDPVNLPLIEKEFTTSKNKGLFRVLSDAGADSWGKKVILSLHNTKPKNRFEFLLAGAGMGVGSLVFSISSSSSKPKVSNNNLGDIPILLKAKDAILADDDIPDEAKKAFEYGSSMGGARPKTIVTDKGVSYLAKFNRADDLFNVVKVEHASMKMLAELPCRVAPTKVIAGASGDVLLVERFDLEGLRPTCHFLSANSVFNLDRIDEASKSGQYTYGYLAEFIMKYGGVPQDAHDLFYRMVFNVYLSNTDDHARNHALLYAFKEREWRLSPAYDVLPINDSQQHGIGIGKEGRQGSVDNLLSQASRFGLSQPKATKIINEVKELTHEWPRYMVDNGVGDGDIKRLKHIIHQFVQ